MVLGLHRRLGQHDSPLIYQYGLLVNYGPWRYFQEVQSRKWTILHLRYPVHAQSLCHPVSFGWTACLGAESAHAPGYCCIPPCWPCRETACSSINHSLFSHLSQLSLPEAMLMSVVHAVAQTHVWVYGPDAARSCVEVQSLCCHQGPFCCPFLCHCMGPCWCLWVVLILGAMVHLFKFFFLPHLFVLCHHFPVPSDNKIMSFSMWNTGVHFIWKGLLCQIIQSFPSLLNVHTFSSHSDPLFLVLSSAIISEDKPIFALFCFAKLKMFSIGSSRFCISH